jgi:hypothetical protein
VEDLLILKLLKGEKQANIIGLISKLLVLPITSRHFALRFVASRNRASEKGLFIFYFGKTFFASSA